MFTYIPFWPDDEVTETGPIPQFSYLTFKVIEEPLFTSVKWTLKAFINGAEFGVVRLYDNKPQDVTNDELLYLRLNRQQLVERDIDVAFEFVNRGGDITDL